MTNRRDFLIKRAAATAGFATRSATRSLASSNQDKGLADSMRFVNPGLRPALQQVSPFLSRLTYNDASLPEVRRLIGANRAAPLGSPAVTEDFIPGARVDPNVRVYVTEDAPGSSKPAGLHIHGGGYIAFQAKDSLRAIQEITVRHQCVVVTVDYRLAPETRFPGSLEDIYAALR